MFVVIVHHWCKAGAADRARARIDHNGDQMAAAAGFVSRYRIENPEAADKVSTVTVWDSERHYRQFKDWQRQQEAGAAGESPYEKVVNEAFEVKKEHRARARA